MEPKSEVRGGKQKEKENPPTIEEVAKQFNQPIDRAAKLLGVGQTWLKHLCREHGIMRWPYRKLQSLQISAQRLSESIAGIDPNSPELTIQELQRYHTVREQVAQLHQAHARITMGLRAADTDATMTAQGALKEAQRTGRLAAEAVTKEIQLQQQLAPNVASESKPSTSPAVAQVDAVGGQVPPAGRFDTLPVESGCTSFAAGSLATGVGPASETGGSLSRISLGVPPGRARIVDDFLSTADSPRRDAAGLRANPFGKAPAETTDSTTGATVSQAVPAGACVSLVPDVFAFEGGLPVSGGWTLNAASVPMALPVPNLEPNPVVFDTLPAVLAAAQPAPPLPEKDALPCLEEWSWDGAELEPALSDGSNSSEHAPLPEPLLLNNATSLDRNFLGRLDSRTFTEAFAGCSW